MKDKIANLLSQMTIEEKISLFSGKDFWHLKGIERLDLPSIMVTDGPHGIRKQSGSSDHLGILDSVKATCYPTAVGLASTWNDELIFQVGEKLGKECISENVSVLLGPGANIKRNPLCGRNFEYFSEDPYLTGKIASSFINGVQSKGIGTSLKHFVANNQETMRMTVDALVDERTLREIYLKGFEIAVKESQPWTVMCAYNKLNGTYLSENERFLDTILKQEWKHNGLVVTDWGACNNRVKGLLAGQELEMPSSNGMNNSKILAAYEKGIISEELINDRASRILELILKSKETLEKEEVYDKEEHHQFARKVAAETIVLLKNDQNILPLNKKQKVALIGEFAVNPRYQGSGSSLINPTKIANAYDAFKEELGTNFYYAKGYHSKEDSLDMDLIKEAVEVAKKAEVVVIMVGLTDIFESEGFDRTHLNIPNNHIKLIEEITKVNQNIVVALSNGSPIVMPWKGDVKAIVEQYLGGQASGEALADVVFGKVNPSGKLAETFPNNLDEFPSNKGFLDTSRQEIYKEGLYVGYRYYDSANVDPLYPFGFGLSYTTFKYDNLKVEQNESLKLTFDITNTGEIKGKEIAQIYISKDKSVIYRPMQELKGYIKVELDKGETKTIELDLPKTSLESFNNDKFGIENGIYKIKVGSSSKNILLEDIISIKNEIKFSNDNNEIYHDIDNSFNPSTDDFKSMYKNDFPSVPPIKPYTINSTFEELSSTFIGRKMKEVVLKEMSKMFSGDKTESNAPMQLMMESMINEMPFRNLIVLGNGAISEKRALGLLDLMNRKFVRGIFNTIKG